VVPERSNREPEDALRAVLRGLAVSARESNLARAAVLEAALAALDAGSLAPEEREAAIHAAHQVVGSAGTFGRRRSSELAAGLERFFRQGLDGAQDPEGLERARAAVAELREDLTRDHQEET
jgi:HPt (histidine-containing phosphotransfer) domain-containing protein